MEKHSLPGAVRWRVARARNRSRHGDVWYAGMEGNTAHTSGVFRTADAGRSWTLLPGTKGIAIWSLSFAPSNPDVMAARRMGVYLTHDSGANWKRISPAEDRELRPVVSLAFDPGDTNTLYAENDTSTLAHERRRRDLAIDPYRYDR